MRLTPEQAQVAQARGPVVRVTAYAGTGKTASLVAWAQAHPAVRTLYVAFNKSVQLAAQKRFPRSVRPLTGHALAFRAVGQRYRDKLVGDLKPYQLVQAGVFSSSRVPPAAQAQWADVLVRTVQGYLASSDAQLGPQHVPLTAADWQGPFAWADPVQAVRDATQLWHRMQDSQDTAVGMVHDGYLKLYVLQQPRLPYDAVLFDEAQDANPVILQLVLGQRHAQQLYVGDPYQGIYQWRGAVDAMTHIQAHEQLRLTASFRFGPTIARWATTLLRWFDPAVPALRGLAPVAGPVYAGVGSAPVTFLARSNARLFATAVTVLDQHPQTLFHWIGGIEGYRLDWLEDTARLWQSEPVTTPFLRLFPDFDTLYAYATAVDDVEWMGRCRLVERWGRRLPALIRRVQAASRHPDQATVAFATIHKAKGLEWPHVVILDDMAPLDETLSVEDQHLWYVAVTRATHTLGVPETAWLRLRPGATPPKRSSDDPRGKR